MAYARCAAAPAGTVLAALLLLLSAAAPTTTAPSATCSSRVPPGYRILTIDDPDASSSYHPQAVLDRALKLASKTPVAVLFAENKAYRLASLDPAGHAPILNITSQLTAHPLLVDGCGASIVVTTPLAGFCSISSAPRLTIRNISSIDYDPLPFTQGLVTAVRSPTEYTLAVDDGFPSLMLPHFLQSVRWLVVKDKNDPKRQRHKLGT